MEDKKKNVGTVKINRKEQVKLFLKSVGVQTLAGLLLVFGADSVVRRTFTTDLPRIEDVDNNLDETDSRTEIYSEELVRFVFPRSGKLKVNVKIPQEKLTDRFKNVLEDSIAEINEVLAMIEPSYSLEIEYNPNIFDTMYSFNLMDAQLEKSETQAILGSTETKYIGKTISGYGRYIVDVKIDLDYLDQYESEHYYNVVKHVLCHEIAGHGLGDFKDAYLLDDYDYDTIMKSANPRNENDKLFSKSDLMMLFSMYSNNTNYEDWEKKIDNYISTKDWYKSLQVNVEFVKNNFYDAYVVKNGLEQYIKPEDIKYEDLGKFCIRLQEPFDDLAETEDAAKLFMYFSRNSGDKLEFNGFLIALQQYGKFYEFESEGIIDNIEGVVCNGNCVYVKIGDDTMVCVTIENTDGKLAITEMLTYDIISEKEYKNEVSSLKKIAENCPTDDTALDYLSNEMLDYLKNNNISFKNISKVDEYSECIKMGKSIEDGQVFELYQDFIKFNDKYYSFTVKDGLIFTDNGFIIVPEDDYFATIYKRVYDIENGKLDFTEYSKMFIANKDALVFEEQTEQMEK